MEFSSFSNFDFNKNELVIFPYWEGEKKAESAFSSSLKLPNEVKIPIENGDFKGLEASFLILYYASCRILLLGLGKKNKVSIEVLRRSYSGIVKICQNKVINKIDIIQPVSKKLDEDEVLKGITEGILLTNYSFNKLKTKAKEHLVKQVSFYDIQKKKLDSLKKYDKIMQGVYLARDLVNGNADDVTATYLVKVANDLSKKYPKLKSRVLNKKQLEKEKLGLLLAVNRGSVTEPALIVLSYNGNAKSKDHTLLVGKGVTYDTGGLNLKPYTSMETMKADMAGSACVLSVLQVVAALQLKVNVTAVVGATENSISENSFKPGDVYKSYKGLTVEVNNPDAEGRLVLADAISYGVKNLHPTRIIDVATLTGGVDVALGNEASGLFSNDDKLSDLLVQSGNRTYERLWRFPLYDEYKEALTSDIADMKNSAGRSASSIVGAMFIQEFVDNISWAHLDIASTAFLQSKKRYNPKYATGVGVRLLVDFLESL